MNRLAIEESTRTMTPLEEAERNSRLWYVADACSAIVKFSSGTTLDDFKANEMLRNATEYELMLAGKATKRLAQHNPEIASKLPATPEMLTIADRLAYGQPRVDDEVLWRIITTEVPALLAEVHALLPSG